MRDDDVLLGFEVGTGEAVRIPVGHTIATGQTQAAGKTTAFEGLVSRSGRTALAFRTKRGEGAFAGARVIPPFFKERTDWRFVESIVGAVLRQGMRFERTWIIKASRGCDTLAEVRRRARVLMQASKRGFDKDIFMLLGEYLDLVLPLLEKIPRADKPHLAAGGTSVMDLGAFPLEVQMLVLHSTMTWVYEHAEDVLTVVPESWEFVPQKKDSPAKIATIALARKGAALRNFLYVDSQDLAGLDKEVVRQMRVYLLGVQRERNEIKRTLDHIPSGMRKPKGEDLARLGRGQFFACWDDRIVKVYAMPSWAIESEARAAAVAAKSLHRGYEPGDGWLSPAAEVAREPDVSEEDPMSKGTEDKLAALLDRIELVQRGQELLVEALGKGARSVEIEVPMPVGGNAGASVARALDALPGAGDAEELMFRRFRDRLLRDPIVLKVLATEKRIEVVTKEQTIEADGSTMAGRVALLLRDGFYDEGKTGNATWMELRRRGYPSKANVPPGSLYEFLTRLAADGFLTVEGKVYSTNVGAAKRVRERAE